LQRKPIATGAECSRPWDGWRRLEGVDVSEGADLRVGKDH